MEAPQSGLKSVRTASVMGVIPRDTNRVHGPKIHRIRQFVDKFLRDRYDTTCG